MTDRPTAEQVNHLLGHADTRRLTPAEAALLRAAVQQYRAQIAAARQILTDWTGPRDGDQVHAELLAALGGPTDQPAAGYCPTCEGHPRGAQ